MFVDQVKILVKAGDGGNGCVSFRREAHVPRGGPDGGTGGKGGDVALLAVSHQNTLLPLRYHAEFRADRGRHGGPANRTGAEGEDLVVPVPPGTAAREADSGAARSCTRATGSSSHVAGAAGAATARSSPIATALRANPSRVRRARSAGCGSTCG
jgi:GTP-binding protein